MDIKKRRTRMYDPWGYQEQNDYQGATTILDNELASLFANVTYVKDDNKIHFSNLDGEELATIDVSDFVVDDKVIERAWYENGKIYIKFTNGDIITIDVEELIDKYEFTNGLQVNDGVVSIKIDESTEPYVSVGENGIKIIGVDEKVEAEKQRALAAESEIKETASGASNGLSTLINALGYTDNETLVRNNEHEVAFGTYNISNTDENASGQTIFSVGNGTSDENRSNAIEIRKDGTVYMWVEGDFIQINDLLGMLAHEVYDD